MPAARSDLTEIRTTFQSRTKEVEAGGGKEITIGEMVKQFLNKLEWFDTRFPRIPVPVQKEITDYFEQMEKYTIGHEDVQEAGCGVWSYSERASR